MNVIDLENGKYTVQEDNGKITVLRHGEVWRDETGDSLILALIQRIQTLEEKQKKH